VEYEEEEVEAVRSYRGRRGQTTSRTTQIRSGYDCQMMITRLTTARHPLLAASCKQRGKQRWCGWNSLFGHPVM